MKTNPDQPRRQTSPNGPLKGLKIADFTQLAQGPFAIRVPGDTAAVMGVGSVPDGLAFDTDGFLCVSCYGDNHIWRVSPLGKKSLFASDPSSILLNRATNAAFSGPGRHTLFIANLGGWHIAKIKAPIAGQPLAGS